jgi:hypothetical protein
MVQQKLSNNFYKQQQQSQRNNLTIQESLTGDSIIIGSSS